MIRKRWATNGIVAVALLAALLIADVAQAETLYVQAKTAQLRSGRTSLDAVVAHVRFGEPLEVVSREGSWVKVKTTGGTQGWIFANKLSETKPSGGGETLAALGRSMRRGAASATTASAGARGLDKTSEAYADRSGISQKDREAVDRMTAYQLADQDVETFLKEGGLGEYAK